MFLTKYCPLIRCHRTKFSRPADLAPGVCAPMVYTSIRNCPFLINSGMCPQFFFFCVKQRNIKFYENPFPWSKRRVDLKKYRRSFLQVSIANAARMTKRPTNTQNSLLQTTGKPADADGRSAKLCIYWHCVYLRRTCGTARK